MFRARGSVESSRQEDAHPRRARPSACARRPLPNVCSPAAARTREGVVYLDLKDDKSNSSASNGSGDYVLAFSTSPMVRRRVSQGGGTASPVRQVEDLGNDAMSALFQGVVEATEEAIYNSLFKATTVTSRGRTIEALPLDRLREILTKYNVTNR